MSYFPKWKIVVVVLVGLLGFTFAAPNLLSREHADRLPSWLQPVSLGLDLQGGSYLLLEVDTGYVVREQISGLVESIRTTLRKEKIKYSDLGVRGDTVSVRILDVEDRERAGTLLRKIDISADLETKEDGLVQLRYSEQAIHKRKLSAVEQSLEIVRRRIDQLGTREPSIQRQGEDRIVVQLPGVKDPDHIKSLLGKTAKLTFHLLDDSVSAEEAARGRVPPGSMVLPGAEHDRGQPEQYVVRKRVEVGGDMLTDSSATYSEGRPVVSFRFNAAGAKKFGDATRDNAGHFLAIVLDEKVISAPRINEPILGGSGIISGSFTLQQVQDLSMLLRAGALPAPLQVLEERTVGPDLGADSIRAGAIACIIGLILVVITMLVVYGSLGMLADLAMVFNLVLLLAALSALGATLTLPGIAGVVLTMGMAVDANVLIYERMREEQRNGRTLMSALQAGYDRAFGTIFDAHVTTLVAAALLFQFGSGPVRGFAVTLSLGLLASLFTAVLVNRMLVVWWVRWRKMKTLPLA
ncbi:protein translocase subunit SecD [Magnetospirillum molischianum]|uniref:Protein translocase subunit SecD n=1 Tax=Magnetospirillum molischianum DSM 120 TaxID=1150626 RepID=H8FR23_MAGML|nr:protein translocase subunit SecD [Magnetospirillum molischianum]CCG40811.1 Protein-export membrane protein secD [Magnetospirillum molischianum DSM 120]